MIGRKLLHLLAFAALAGATALTVGRVVQPSINGDLLMVALLGVMVGLPGLIDRRLAPFSALLLPLTAGLLLVTLAPVPPEVAGLSARVAFYAEELRFGLRAYAEDIFPLTLAGTPGLRLLVLLWVYGLVGAASYLALVHGRVLAATGALFALMAMCLTVDDGGGGTAIILAFLGLVVLALLTAQGLSRGSWGLRDALSGLLVGAVSLVLAVGLLTTAPGIAAKGWQDWRQWNPLGGGNQSELVFNWRQNYPRLLDPKNDIPLMQVTSPVPSYWRANTLDVFTSDSWLSVQSFDDPLGSGPGDLALTPPDIIPRGNTVEQRFDLGDIATNYVFTGGIARILRLDVEAEVAASDAGALRAAKTLGPNMSYTVTALVPEVAPQDLVGRGRDYPESVLPYAALALPSAATVDRLRDEGRDWTDALMGRDRRMAEFAGLYDLNRKILKGATDPYQQTLRIESHLRRQYRYSLQPPPSDFTSPYAAFLFDNKTGYCQHFAGAMALLLRINGIPARVAVGFVTGETVGPDTYLVTSNNAHSWVEVYFPEVGWLPFDPTPGQEFPGEGPSTASPGFVSPFVESPLDPPATATTLPTTPPGRTSAQVPEDAAGTSPMRPLLEQSSRAWPLLPAVAALLVLWPAALHLVRRRRLRRGTPAERLSASLTALREDLAGAGFPLSRASTLEESGALTASRLDVDLGPLSERAQAVLFGGYCATPKDVAQAEAVRLAVGRALRRQMGWTWTLAQWYGYAGLLRRYRARRALRAERPRLRSRTAHVAR